MKRIFTLILLFSAMISSGQNFHFEPLDVLSKTITTEDISDLTIDIIRNNTVDTLYLEYELITNTLPAEWYQGYCDNHGCWGSLPESGTMSACYDDLNSYITLSIHPNGLDGSGVVEYYVYEVGHYEDGLLMRFNVDTPGFVGIEETESNQVSFYPNPAQDFINIESNEKIVDLSIFSLTGQMIQQTENPSSHNKISIANLKSGIYLIKSTDVSGVVFTQKLKKL
jgi:hypothetical protein